jgi:hypothetical protein
MIDRRLVALVLPVLFLASACGDEDTFQSFDGEYRFYFPADRDAGALEAVAEKCGVGHGVEAAEVVPDAADDGQMVVVKFEDASAKDQERVALCVEAEGSTGKLVM